MNPRYVMRFYMIMISVVVLGMIAVAVIDGEITKIKYPVPPELNCGAIRC